METSVNNKCKAFTSMEQSKVLAEILPLESADMKWYFWKSEIDAPKLPTFGYGKDAAENCKSSEAVYLPCWSLAALLGVLPTLDDRNANFCKDIRYGKWHVYYHSTATLSIIDTERYDNLIDACVAMIEKLHELKML